MWWRSLLVKQMLAFLAISITGVLIAGIFLRVSTQQGFDTYVQAQAKHELVAQLGTYHQAMGSWKNVAAFYHAPDGATGLMSFTVLDAQNVLLAGTGFTLGQVAPATVGATATPILVNQRVVGRAVFPAAFPNSALEQTYSRHLNDVLLLASLVALGLALLLSTSLTRPVRALTNACMRDGGNSSIAYSAAVVHAAVYVVLALVGAVWLFQRRDVAT